MVVLVLLVPLYLVIANSARAGTAQAPMLGVDRLLPLVPVWAHLTVWIVAYAVFLLYPTVAPRPESVTGDGFGVWGLRFLYTSDPPYNCFPSIHVAHSFVSVLACYRVHWTLGVVTITCASLVALSTLFTRQHYVADLVAGILLALAACALFLRHQPRATIPAFDRCVAPALTLALGGLISLSVAGTWVVYRLRPWG